MFRKLVSNLPFSPALVGQLGLYAGRLRKEQAVRRLGLLFVVAALVIQSFAIFSPPEQASANSPSPVIPGGVTSVQQILNTYDASAAGQNDFKNLMDYFGVTRTELQSMDKNVAYICSNDHSIVSFSREHHYSTSEGELTHKVPTNNGFATFYSVPLYRFDEASHQTNCYDSYVGHSSKVGWFAIMRKCGNFQVKQSANLTPRAHLINATCSSIQGFAYDERNQDQKVKVYLYFAGPPGKGDQYGPVIASAGDVSSPVGNNHGFSFAVPDKYQGSISPTSVWAVMQPLSGWSGPMVQSDNQLTVPANCKAATSPVASCDALKVNLISKDRVSLTSSTDVARGAVIQGYKYTVTNANNTVVYAKTVSSNSVSNTSDSIQIKNPGAYIAKTTLTTSIGDITSQNCMQPFSISPVGACPFNAATSQKNSSCQACPYDPTTSATSDDCSPKIILSKEAFNLSQDKKDANNTTANPGDRIQFDLHTTNVGSTTQFPVQENIGDLLEYSSIIDAGGANFDANTNTLSWGNVSLARGSTDTRSFVIQINDTIAATPRAANDPAAYNCAITSSYGNTIRISMVCPFGKTVENTIKLLPIFGLTENITFSIILLCVAAYLYLRSRQINREVRVIRKDFNV